MKLLELHIDGFGKFHDKTLSFQDGINVVYGKNEAGKSTLHTFIRGMLFGIERGRGRAARNDVYSKFEPWESSGTYEGYLRLESHGTVYRVERRFRRDSKALKVINETLGLEEETTPAFMEELLGGLNETTYNNTISIGQLKSATEDGMVGELRNFIANMNTTGNISLNITKASSFLRGKKRELEADLIPDASRDYTSLLSEIRSLDAEISSPEYENQLVAYQNIRSQVRNVIESVQSEKDALSEKLQKGKQVLGENGFSDLGSITSYAEKAEAVYEEYLDALEESSKKRWLILMIFSFLTGLCGFGDAAYLAYTDLQAYLPLCIAAGAAGIALFGTGLLLAHRRRKYIKQLAQSKQTLEQIFSKHLGDGSVSPEAINAFRGRMAEFKRLSGMVSESEAAVAKYMENLSELQEKQNNCSEMIEQQQRTQWELEKKLEHLTSCKNQAEALKRVLAENDRIREEVTAIELAMETMTDLSSSIRDSFGLYLNKTASEYINGITGGIYDSMSIDENLDIFLNTQTKLVPIGSVSSGTMDQVYLALRLAAAKLLQNGGEPLPLIFDDSFTLYDDERLRTALKWLSKAVDSQVIIFTCHHREAQMLRANQVGFHLIEI